MEKTITVIDGKVVLNPYGDWSDVATGIYFDGNNIENIFSRYIGKRIRVMIEEIE